MRKARQGDITQARRFATSVHPTQDEHAAETSRAVVGHARVRKAAELYDLTGKKQRIVLSNPDTAKKIVDVIGLNAMANVTVLDLYAGSLL